MIKFPFGKGKKAERGIAGKLREAGGTQSEALVDTHLRLLSLRHGFLQLKGLTRHQAPRIETRQIYISLNAVMGEDYGEQTGYRQDGAADDEQTGDRQSESRPLDTDYYQQDPRSGIKLALLDLLFNFQHLVVVGEPGSGKSTFLAYAILELIEKSDQFSARLGLEHAPIPFFLSLASLQPWTGPDPESLIRLCLPEPLREQSSYFESLVETRGAVFFLDGLDEVSITEERRRVSSWIDEACSHYPDCRFVVTARLIGYRAAPLGDRFQKLSLCRFDAEDIHHFVHRWQTLTDVRHDQETEAEQRTRIRHRSEELLAIMDEKPRIRELADNPLLLTIILLVFNSRNRLPEERVRLYDECLDVLLENLQKARVDAGQRGDFKTTQGLKLEQQRDLLKALAFHLHERGTRERPPSELIALLGTLMPEIGLDAGDATQFIDEVVERAGLLVHRGPNLGFSHHTFQEYLTALDLADRENQDRVLDFLCAGGQSSWWREVIQLYAGSIANAGGLIRRLREVEDTPFKHTLILAGQCLADARKIRDLKLRRALLEDLVHLHQTTTIPYQHALVQTVLVRIGTPELAAMLEDLLEDAELDLPQTERAVSLMARLELGTPVKRAMTALLSRESVPASVRQAAVAGLAHGGRIDAEIEALLLDLIHGDDPVLTREEALRTLGKLSSDPRVIARIASLQQTDSLDRMVVTAFKSFARMLDAPRAFSTIKAHLERKGGTEFKVELCRALTWLRLPEKEITDYLIDLVEKGPDWGARGGAALALGLMKENRERSALFLARRLEEEQAYAVRLRIAEALTQLTWWRAEIVGLVKQAMEYETHRLTRYKLREVYALMSRDEAFARLLEADVYNDELEPHARHAALDALARLDQTDERSATRLIDHLPEFDHGARVKAMQILSHSRALHDMETEYRERLHGILVEILSDQSSGGALSNLAFRMLYDFHDFFSGNEQLMAVTPTRQMLPIGESDFETIIRKGLFYVDKSLLIRELAREAKVVLIPRPRRFGKTLNMRMLRVFYENAVESRADLFSGLEVSRYPEIMQHQGQFPVIWLSFRKKTTTAKACISDLERRIAEEMARHLPQIEASLDERERAYCTRIIDRSAGREDFEQALLSLSSYLERQTGRKVIVLIDEYDTPLLSAHEHGFLEDVLPFWRNLLSETLKDNTHLERGVLTGIMRIAKESVFSGLNNLEVFSFTQKPFADKFGLTESEVREALVRYDLLGNQRDVSEWYNGYCIGGRDIYNPWSIINYLKERQVRPYWIKTSGNEIIRDLVLRGQQDLRDALADLMADRPVVCTLREHIAFKDITADLDLVLSFLAFTGYLAIEELPIEGSSQVRLRIPNQEVRGFFDTTFADWLKSAVSFDQLQGLFQSLIDGEIPRFRDYLSKLVEEVMSFHDPQGKEPERVYHAFVLGLLAQLRGRYRVTSNRESGYGRYDIALRPRMLDERGIILEFKTIESEEPRAALDAALNQIVDQDYAQSMRVEGFDKILIVAVAFKGKRVWADGKEIDFSSTESEEKRGD